MQLRTQLGPTNSNRVKTPVIDTVNLKAKLKGYKKRSSLLPRLIINGYWAKSSVGARSLAKSQD